METLFVLLFGIAYAWLNRIQPAVVPADDDWDRWAATIADDRTP